MNGIKDEDVREAHRAEAERIVAELVALGPEFAEDGIVRRVLRERIEEERKLAGFAGPSPSAVRRLAKAMNAVEVEAQDITSVRVVLRVKSRAIPWEEVERRWHQAGPKGRPDYCWRASEVLKTMKQEGWMLVRSPVKDSETR